MCEIGRPSCSITGSGRMTCRSRMRPPGRVASIMWLRAFTTSSGGTHQSDQEKTTRSNEWGVISIDSAAATWNSTRSLSSDGKDARASRTRSSSGSNARTEAASAAMPLVRRPSPQPIASTRRPRKSTRRCSEARCTPSGSSVRVISGGSTLDRERGDALDAVLLSRVVGPLGHEAVLLVFADVVELETGLLDRFAVVVALHGAADTGGPERGVAGDALRQLHARDDVGERE